MPYIPQADRQKFDPILEELTGMTLTVGELNYLITKILKSTDPKSYSDYNELIGVLNCVQLELYRTDVTALELKKMKENGDV